MERGTSLLALPKGPSLDPSLKRLAVPVEDHPLDYADFEGIIPEGEYGGTTIMVWDKGTWAPENPDVDASLRNGDLKFTLRGAKLKGSWALVRARGPLRRTSGKPPWFLIKHRDAFASSKGITETQPRSVVTNRLLAGIAQDGGGDVRKAMTGDPPDEVGPPTKTSTLAIPRAMASETALTLLTEYGRPRVF